MHRLLATLSVAALFAVPFVAGAQSLPPLLSQTTPPSNAPHAFTPAPVSDLSYGSVDPTDRAGGAGDAGPMNATPFSGELSTVLTGTPSGRALSLSRIDHDPSAATQSRD